MATVSANAILPSPLYPRLPEPASVETTLVWVSMSRMSWFSVSTR